MFTIISMTFNAILFTSTCEFYEDSHLGFSPRNYVLLSIIFSNIYLALTPFPHQAPCYIHAPQKLFFLAISSFSAKGSSFQIETSCLGRGGPIFGEIYRPLLSMIHDLGGKPPTNMEFLLVPGSWRVLASSWNLLQNVYWVSLVRSGAEMPLFYVFKGILMVTWLLLMAIKLQENLLIKLYQ